MGHETRFIGHDSCLVVLCLICKLILLDYLRSRNKNCEVLSNRLLPYEGDGTLKMKLLLSCFIEVSDITDVEIST